MDLSSKKTPSIVVEEFLTFGFNTSPMTIDSPKHEEGKLSQNVIIHGANLENHSCCSSSNKKAEKKQIDYQNENEQNNSARTESKFSKRRRNSSGAFNIFRNFITCGAVETNDSSIITMNRTNMPSFVASNENSTSLLMEICESENFVASQQRLLSTDLDIQPTNGRKNCNGTSASSKEKTEFGSNKSFSAAYKPLKNPNCSQCRKPFKPEKLHSHMKSCKGMKALARIPTNSATATDAEKISKDPLQVDSLSRYPLDSSFQLS